MPWQEQIIQFLRQHSNTFLFEDNSHFENPSIYVLEIYSGFKIAIPLKDILKLEIKPKNKMKTEFYLSLLFQDGKQMFFSQAGIAFPLNFKNTGPIDYPNPVISYQDFDYIENLIVQGLQEEPVNKEIPKLIMVCIAALDGANEIDFKCGKREKKLEQHLTHFEQKS